MSIADDEKYQHEPWETESENCSQSWKWILNWIYSKLEPEENMKILEQCNHILHRETRNQLHGEAVDLSGALRGSSMFGCFSFN